MVTMLLGGLWHGANLKFVVWGGIHGVSLVLHKLWTSHSPRVRRADSWWRRAVGAFFTFQLVSFSWIFFRSSTLSSALDMLGQIFTRFGTSSIPQMLVSYAKPFALMLVGLRHSLFAIPDKRTGKGGGSSNRNSVKLLITVLAVLLILH